MKRARAFRPFAWARVLPGHGFSLFTTVTRIVMLGSERNEFTQPKGEARARLFSVQLGGRTLWGWERRTRWGTLAGHSETLFADYVACLCDAQR